MSSFGGNVDANGIRRSGESMIGNIGAYGSGSRINRADIGGKLTIGGNGDANGKTVIGNRADIGGMSSFGGNGNANGIRRSVESMIGNIGAYGSGIGINRTDLMECRLLVVIEMLMG